MPTYNNNNNNNNNSNNNNNNNFLIVITFYKYNKKSYFDHCVIAFYKLFTKKKPHNIYIMESKRSVIKTH